MQLTLSVFPKFFGRIPVPQLAEQIRSAGLDTCNLVIRNGFTVTEENYRQAVPDYVRKMAEAGVNLHLATVGWTAEQLVEDDRPLAVLADAGIRAVRFGYFQRTNAHPDHAIDQAAQVMAQLSERCRQRNIKAVYQVHHGRLVTNSAEAARLIRQTDPAHVGIMLDPGNQAHEGLEHWPTAIARLGPHLAAVGIKDIATQQDLNQLDSPTKGWSRQFVPCHLGQTPWHAIIQALHEADFHGTGVFMPFYHTNEPDRLLNTLAQEVQYLRNLIDQTTTRS